MSTRAEQDMPPSLTVVVPVFQNADTLAPLATRLAETFEGSSTVYRLLFVVDASPDNSWEQVCSLSATDTRVCGLRLARNVGQHMAILEGLRRVTSDWVAIMDADLQDPPEVLQVMWAKALVERVTVAALRSGQYQGSGRMMTSRLFKALLGWWLGMPANAGTFLLLPREVSDRIWKAPVVVPHVVVMARCFSGRWAYIEYQREMRVFGESAYSGWGRLLAALRSLRCAVTCKRMSTTRMKDPEIVMRRGALPGSEYVGHGWP